jgi:hypothetical protein
MNESFAAVVGAPEWRAEALAWIDERLDGFGVALTGEVTQPRIRPWSTQLVVPTDAGRYWFKANCRALAFEPALHAELARLVPSEVESPAAVDPDRGWMLTADRGLTLGEQHEPTIDDWRTVVSLAAELQRATVPRGRELLGVGLPDCSPVTVPARFDEMVQTLAGLPSDHPSHVSESVREELLAQRHTVVEAVDILVDGPMPSTFQHGDLHPRNVFVTDGGLRIFDFGDAMWAHPLEILAVPQGWVTRLTSLPWSEVLKAYAASWADVLPPESLSELLRAALVTHAVNRSQTWAGAIAQADGDELAEWGDAPLYYLRLAVDPGVAESQPSG